MYLVKFFSLQHVYVVVMFVVFFLMKCIFLLNILLYCPKIDEYEKWFLDGDGDVGKAFSICCVVNNWNADFLQIHNTITTPALLSYI